MRRLIGTFATILACVILAGVLLGLYRWNRQNEAEKAAALREKAEQYEQEAVPERNAAESEAAKAVSEAAKAESEAAAPASSAAQAADETVPEEEQAPVTPAAGGAVVISCRGDDFISRSNPGKTYPEYLEEILSAYAEGVTVEDHTWEMAGSLSQLWYAGVPDADLEAYIEKHLEEADSEDELLATDRQLRSDRDEVDRTRTDQDAIPVLCMGFYGGFAGDPEELAEQYELLLSTYSQQDRYLILGCYPNVWEDKEAYDSALEEAFGDHYVSLNRTVTNKLMTEDGRREMAQVIYARLENLGYLGNE